MSSRKDAVQAYSFTVRRLRAGMLHGEPDALDPGSARTWRGVIIGVVVALVVGAGIAIFGAISPAHGDDWRTSGTLVIASDTGARYLYLDELHPVLNQTSARLVAGAGMPVRTVSSDALRGTPQGAPIGLVGAPDSVPAAASLNAGSWLACTVRTTDSDGSVRTRLALRIDDDTTTGRGLTATQAAWVQAPDGTQYLIWAGRRLRLGQGGNVAAALGYGAASPVAVPAGFLDAVPAGADLAADPPAGLGDTGPAIAGADRKVGQLFRDGGGQGYVLARTGLQPVSATRLALLRGDPTVQGQAYGGGTPTVTEIGPQDVPAHPAAASGGGLPASPPRLVTAVPGRSLCVATTPSGTTLTTSASWVATSTVLAGAQAGTAQPGVQPSCEAADLVAVAPGAGTLVAVRTGAGASQTHFLVTDNGVKYPVPAAGLKALGYAAAPAEALPTGLLRLLPSGPSLDPASLARQSVVQPATATGCAG